MSTKKTYIEFDFPSRLRRFIEKDLKISHRQFARNVGTSSGYLSMMVNGKTGPSAEFIASLFFNYRDHLEWLLSGYNKPESISITDADRISQLEKRISDLEKSHDSASEPIKKGAISQE